MIGDINMTIQSGANLLSEISKIEKLITEFENTAQHEVSDQELETLLRGLIKNKLDTV